MAKQSKLSKEMAALANIKPLRSNKKSEPGWRTYEVAARAGGSTTQRLAQQQDSR